MLIPKSRNSYVLKKIRHDISIEVLRQVQENLDLELGTFLFALTTGRLESFRSFIGTFRFFIKLKVKLEGFTENFINSPEFDNVESPFTGFDFRNIRLRFTQTFCNLKLGEVGVFSGSD